MPEIKVGMQGLSHPTPQVIKAIYRAIGLASAIWVMVIQPQFHLPEHIQMLVDKWLLVGNTLIYTLCQFFGWQKPTNP